LRPAWSASAWLLIGEVPGTISVISISMKVGPKSIWPTRSGVGARNVMSAAPLRSAAMPALGESNGIGW
jgi:hypothetical protein